MEKKLTQTEKRFYNILKGNKMVLSKIAPESGIFTIYSEEEFYESDWIKNICHESGFKGWKTESGKLFALYEGMYFSWDHIEIFWVPKAVIIENTLGLEL